MSDHLGCWSCYHYRDYGCDIGRQHEWNIDAGEQCAAFEYEPGSDQAEHEHDERTVCLPSET